MIVWPAGATPRRGWPGLSPKTARDHMSNIFKKINAANRAQATVIARETWLG
jgi:DNA-binding NarL/FixJ family response regulator